VPTRSGTFSTAFVLRGKVARVVEIILALSWAHIAVVHKEARGLYIGNRLPKRGRKGPEESRLANGMLLDRPAILRLSSTSSWIHRERGTRKTRERREATEERRRRLAQPPLDPNGFPLGCSNILSLSRTSSTVDS